MPLLSSLGRSLGRLRVGGSMPGVSKSIVGRHPGRLRCLSTATTLQVLHRNLLWKPVFHLGKSRIDYRPVVVIEKKLVSPEEIIGFSYLTFSHQQINSRFIFPEFLPDPDPNFRNSVAERLQRQDMIARREVVEIPGETSMMKLNQFLNTEF